MIKSGGRIHSLPFFFFVTYKWFLEIDMLHYARLERLASNKHSGLLCPFLIYKENGQEHYVAVLNIGYKQPSLG
jgi:hypothetical protein